MMLLALLAAITLDATACPTGIASCPHKDETTASATIVSPAVTTGTAAELLLLLVTCQSPPLASVTASAGAYSTPVTQLNPNPPVTGGEPNVYYAVTSATLAAVTFTATCDDITGGAITVIPFSASAKTQPPVFSATSVAAVVTVAVTGTTAGSKVYAVGHAPSGARTATANATLLNDENAGTVPFRSWAEFLTGTSAGGTVTIGTTAPADSATLVAVEVCDSTGCIAPAGPANSGMMGFWGLLDPPPPPSFDVLPPEERRP